MRKSSFSVRISFVTSPNSFITKTIYGSFPPDAMYSLISSDFDGISAARIDFTSSDEFTLNGSGKYAEPEFDERLKAAIIAAQSGGVL